MKSSEDYRRMTNSLCALCLVLLSLTAQASTSRIFVLSADEWARPRSGAVIAEFEALRAAVSYWDKVDNAGIIVRYPGEDSGDLGDFLEAQQKVARQEFVVATERLARHAIRAAEVASVGHRDAEIPHGPAELVANICHEAKSVLISLINGSGSTGFALTRSGIDAPSARSDRAAHFWCGRH